MTSEVSAQLTESSTMAPMSGFAELLKMWRKQRRYSQLALAHEANVSARHLACLETGRAQPSAEMVHRLGDALQLPLAARNQMLVRAGFAARYQSRSWSSEELAPVRAAVEWTLSRHAPWPGCAVDRLWRVLRFNPAAQYLFGFMGVQEGDSLLDVMLSDSAPAFVENWPQVAYFAAQRLRIESTAQGGVPELDRAAEALWKVAGSVRHERQPVIATTFRLGSERLSLFSTLAQLGAPDDLTLDDLKIELYFPADSDTETKLLAIAAAATNSLSS